MTYIIDDDDNKKKYYSKLLFLVILVVVTTLIGMLHLNKKIFLLINAYHVYIPNRVLNTINLIAAPKKFILPAILVLLTLIFKFKYLKRVIFLLVTFYVLFFVLKITIHEARPFAVLAQNSMFLLTNNQDKMNNLSVSFPSGHTGLATLFVCVLISIFKIKNELVKLLLSLLPVIVGLTRLMTGWHWPIDVLSSAIISYIIVWFFFDQNNKFKQKKF